MPSKATKKEALPVESVLIFIDAPALNAFQSVNTCSFDHKKFLEFLLRGRNLIAANYYARPPKPSDPPSPIEDEKRKRSFDGFLGHLRVIGYETIVTEDHETDVDTLPAADIRRRYLEADTIIFVGGDHYYHEPLKLAYNEGKRIEIFCSQNMLFGLISEIADQVIDPASCLDEIIDQEKTARFRQKANVTPAPITTTSNNMNSVVSMSSLPGAKVQVETGANNKEIIIRITLP